MNTVRIETLGCRLNQIESESAARIFLNYGYDVKMQTLTAETSPDKNTILCIINTCTVTQKAEQKARRIIRLCLKKFENACIIVTGCYAQLSKEEITDIDKRICVIGGQIKSRLSKIPELLKLQEDYNPFEFAKTIKEKIADIPQDKPGFPEDSFRFATSSFLIHSRASLKIQDGCNNNCSYCAIHLARGHSVSLDVKTAIERVQEIEASGNDEVVLTTINIAQYNGRFVDKDGKEKYCNFAELLELLLKNTSKINFRISSLYPEIIDKKFLSVIKDKRVCPHFHLSVQSGSNKILSLMNRRYTSQDIEKVCRELRKVKDNPFIACDIITGFPGETEDDFNQTIDLCKKCNFTWIHAFPFSERKNTKALELKNKVPQEKSGERVKILTDLAVKNKIDYINSFKNKKMNAVLESVKLSQILKDDYIKYHAVTQNFIHCEIISKEKKETCKTVQLKIIEPLKEKIEKGGEIEAKAEFV